MKTLLCLIIETSFLYSQPPATNQSADWSAHTASAVELVKQNRYAEAETPLRLALADAEAFPENDPRLSATLVSLAMAREQQSDFAEAERLDRRALSLRESSMPANDPRIADSLGYLGGILLVTGRGPEAYPLLRRALEIDESAGDDARCAKILNDLGLTLMRLGEPARAEPVLRRSRALFEKTKGADSLDAARVADSIATLESSQHEYAKAETELRRALPVFERELGAESPLVAAILDNLFAVVFTEKRRSEAEPLLRRAVAILDHAPANNLQTLRIRAYQAGFESDLGNLPESSRLFEEVIASEERILGPSNPQLAETLTAYSAVLRALHRKAEAKQAETRAAEILRSQHQSSQHQSSTSHQSSSSQAFRPGRPYFTLLVFEPGPERGNAHAASFR